MKELNAKGEREIRAKLKRKIEGDLQINRELKCQVAALKVGYLDGDISD